MCCQGDQHSTLNTLFTINSKLILSERKFFFHFLSQFITANTGNLDGVKSEVVACVQEDLVQNVVQEPVYKCQEKQKENCHITFVTTFKSHSEEDCADHFEKKCQIRKGISQNVQLYFTLLASYKCIQIEPFVNSFRQEASVEKIINCYQ